MRLFVWGLVIICVSAEAVADHSLQVDPIQLVTSYPSSCLHGCVVRAGPAGSKQSEDSNDEAAAPDSDFLGDRA